MQEEQISPLQVRTEVKPSRSKVIPITSISDLGTIVGDIQNQLTLLINKLEEEVSPEFKALMEGFVNKANETEKVKVNLENLANSHEEIKSEITKVRETNRNLVQELQCAREILKNLERDLEISRKSFKQAEENYKEKINVLNKKINDYELKLSTIEEEKNASVNDKEKTRQELLDQKYNFHQKEQEITIERDNLKKQIEELELLLKDQTEKLELKTKELDYKDVLLKELIKKTMSEKLFLTSSEDSKNNPLLQAKKKKFIFF